VIIPFPEDLWLQFYREREELKKSKMAGVTFALCISFSFIKTREKLWRRRICSGSIPFPPSLYSYLIIPSILSLSPDD